MQTSYDFGHELLDSLYDLLQSQHHDRGMDKLMFGLLRLRNQFHKTEWEDFYLNSCRRHPLNEIVQQSPFTSRAFQKPRGYAGDAIMMDYIYHRKHAGNGLTEDGRKVYDWEYSTPGCASVRERRDIAAQYVDRVCAEKKNARILSVACGHLREARQSAALAEGRVGEFWALDQDINSLEVVESEEYAHQVKTARESVKSILKGKVNFTGFDLIYSLGLYDYLSRPIAQRLTTMLFRMLAPGGKLLLVNFAPNLQNIGYMEAYMDWHLIYRDEVEIEQLAEKIPPEQTSNIRTFRDSYKNFVFLELARR